MHDLGEVLLDGFDRALCVNPGLSVLAILGRKPIAQANPFEKRNGLGIEPISLLGKQCARRTIAPSLGGHFGRKIEIEDVVRAPTLCLNGLSHGLDEA